MRFPDEFKSLVSKKPISPNYSIYSFAPFFDKNNLSRIKGKCIDSDSTIDEKHLPRDSGLTELIVVFVKKKSCWSSCNLSKKRKMSKFLDN